MNVQDLALFGISGAALVVALTQGFKLLLPIKTESGSAWLALIVSLGVSGLGYTVNAYPQTAGIIGAIVAALVLWLMATGLYNKVNDAVGSKLSKGGGTGTDAPPV